MLNEFCTYTSSIVWKKDVSAGVVLRQRVQQCLRLLQVRRVKALGEPAVDLSEQLVSFGVLLLALPQSCEAHRRP